MNILIISEFFPESGRGEITGGVEARAFFVAKELAKRNNVYVITSRRAGSKPRQSFLGINVIRVGPSYRYTKTGHLLKRLGFGLRACFVARRLAKNRKIDVVDGYSFFAYLASIFAGFGTKAKCFLTYHEVWIGRWTKTTENIFGLIGELAERVVLLKARLSKTEAASR